MTVATHAPDPLADLRDLEERIRQIEQGRDPRAGFVGDPAWAQPGVVADNSGFVSDATIPAPTGLTLTTSSFFDQIVIDVSFTASAGTGSERVQEYEIELTETGFGVLRYVRTAGTGTRLTDLKPNQQYSVRVRALANAEAKSSAFTASQTITTGADAALPGQVTGLIASAGFRSVTARWNEGAEPDVKNGQGLYEVQLDTSNAFNTANLRTVRVSALITAFTDLVTGTTYYVRVRAIDTSGNFGPFSAIVSAVTGQAGGTEIQNGTITTDHIVTAGLDAAVIKFGTMSGDRITANTLDANRIKTSELTAAIVTITSSGMLRAGRTTAPFHYLILDAAGIRFFKDGSAAFTGGTLTAELNVSTGSATFSGSITGSTFTGGTFRTALSGRRVQMSDQSLTGYDPHEIRLFTGDASEFSGGLIAGYINTGAYGTGGLRVLTTYIESPAFDQTTGKGWLQLDSRRADGGGLGARAILGVTGGGSSYVEVSAVDGIRLEASFSKTKIVGPLDIAGLVTMTNHINLNNNTIRTFNNDGAYALFYSGTFVGNVLTGGGNRSVLAAGSGADRVCGIADGSNGNVFRIIDYQYSNHKAIIASAFTPSSDPSTKENIKLADATVLPELKATPISLFNLKGDQKTRIGPMATQVSPLLQTDISLKGRRDAKGEAIPDVPMMGIDLMSAVGYLWKGIQELADDLDAVKAAIAPLLTKPR